MLIWFLTFLCVESCWCLSQNNRNFGRRSNDKRKEIFTVLNRNRRIILLSATAGTAVSVSSSRQVRRSVQFQIGLASILSVYLRFWSTYHLFGNNVEIDTIHQKTALQVEALVRKMRGAYVKSAQLVATAFPEALPDAWVARLETLVDDAPARPWTETRQVLENELGAKLLNASFIYINPEPIAAASIGQVHQGILRSPTTERRVAVKVTYPGVDRLIMSDLSNIRRVIRMLKPALLPAIDEFRARVSGEFDFIAEARRADSVAAFFERRPDLRKKVIAPRSVPGLTTRRVLVMDWLDGKSLRDSLRLEYTQATKESYIGIWKTYKLFRLRRKARKALETVAMAHGAMIFDHGAFTVDPHPGNIVDCRRSRNGRIGIIDFGSFQTFTPQQRAKLAALYSALYDRDTPAIVSAMTALGFRSKNTDPEFVCAFATQCFDRDIVDTSPYQLLASMEEQDKLLAIPSSYMLAARVSLLIRGLARRLGYSDFSCSALWRDEFARCLSPADI